MTSDTPDDLATAIALGGEMGRRFGEYDWDFHPLGSVSGWPTEMRATVAVALTSQFPIVLWLGADDLFLIYNDRYIPMLGDKHPAALGLPGRQVWWDIWDTIAPMLAGVIATGRATWSDDLRLALVTAGERHERYFTFSYSPIVAPSGDVSGVFCAVAETTERVLGERRLQILNATAAAVMETRTVDDAVRATIQACGETHPDLPFVAVYVDGAPNGGGVLRGSSERVAELLPHSLAGLTGSDHPWPPSSTMLVIENLDQLVPSLPSVFRESCPRQALAMPLIDAASDAVIGCMVVGVNAYRSLDEQYRTFCRLLADQVAAAFVTARSYDQERQRAEMLAQLDRAKTAFLTNVSHEFRTPLTLLLGPLEDALRDTNEPLQRDRLEVARRNAGRLLRLVNSLLEFSRIEAGRVAVSPVSVDLGALTSQIASTFDGLCARAGIDLVLECDSVVADVDVTMWETIVLNLMSNAVKFTLSGSITVVVTSDSDQHCRVEVRDTGTGIPPAEMDRLFERFYRASNARGRSVEGSGVGLSLVRNLVELNGGTIDIESQVDVGTTMTITLPVGSSSVVALNELSMAEQLADNAYVVEAMQWINEIPTEPRVRSTPGVRSRPLILIADDNSDMRAHLERILSRHWDTMTFPDGQAALEGVRLYRPDVIISDVMMPGLDGFGLVTAVRNDSAIASTPVIMLSARAGVEAAGDGFARGADDYLTKPFTSQDLLNHVEARLAAVARQHAARKDEETRARHDAALADVTGALASAESMDSMLTALSAALAGSIGVVAVAIGLIDHDTHQVTVHYGGTIEAFGQDPAGPLAEVARTGRQILIEDLPVSSNPDDGLARWGSHGGAAAIVALRDTSAVVLGAVALLWPSPQTFGPAEVDLIGDVAGVAGTTITRIVAAEREHQIATDFQDHLLDLDRRSGAVVVSAIYQPASEAMRVGGDWYLVTPLDGAGRVAMCVGDVVGHGLEAATVMGRLRSATAATALTAPDPASVVSAVDRYAYAVPGATCATLAFVVVDTAEDTVSYVCAGHPYPVVVSPTGEVQYLEEGRRPPLSTHAGATDPRPGRASLPRGSLLIMYTDGLIERHDESLSDGFDKLSAAASTCADLPVDLVCTTLLDRLTPVADHRDDVVILAMRSTGVTDTSFVATVPSDLAQVTLVRHRLQDWLAGLGVDGSLQHHIVLCVGETLANAIEHGNQMDPEMSVSIEIFAHASTIDATIGDVGLWMDVSTSEPADPERGRGLKLVRSLADQVDVVRTPYGTNVHLQFSRMEASRRADPTSEHASQEAFT